MSRTVENIFKILTLSFVLSGLALGPLACRSKSDRDPAQPRRQPSSSSSESLQASMSPQTSLKAFIENFKKNPTFYYEDDSEVNPKKVEPKVMKVPQELDGKDFGLGQVSLKLVKVESEKKKKISKKTDQTFHVQRLFDKSVEVTLTIEFSSDGADAVEDTVECFTRKRTDAEKQAAERAKDKEDQKKIFEGSLKNYFSIVPDKGLLSANLISGLKNNDPGPANQIFEPFLDALIAEQKFVLKENIDITTPNAKKRAKASSLQGLIKLVEEDEDLAKIILDGFNSKIKSTDATQQITSDSFLRAAKAKLKILRDAIGPDDDDDDSDSSYD